MIKFISDSHFYVLLAETVYYILFGQKSACLHIGTSIFIWPALYIIFIHILLLDYVYLCIHVKGSMWPFYHNMQIFSSYEWTVHKQHISLLILG